MRTVTVIATVMLMMLFSIQGTAQTRNQEVTAATAGPMMGQGMMGHGKMMRQGKMGGGGMMGCRLCGICGMTGKAGMHHGMGKHGMMGCELHHFMKVIYHLPDLRSQLDLTREQFSRLKSMQSDFLKNKADWKAEIEKKRIDLDNQLGDSAVAADIRDTLESMSKVMVEMKVSGYETGRKMLDVLQPEQKRRWCDFCSSCLQQYGEQ